MSTFQKSEKSISKHTNKERRPARNIKTNNGKAVNKSSLNKEHDVKKENNKKSDREVLENHTRTDLCVGERVTDLSSPGLCSALQLAHEIQAASAGTTKVEELKLFQQKQLDEAIKQKAMKIANVPFTKHIFKDLIDLHISDEEIPSGKTQQKTVNFLTNKDPVFRLEDFYKPDFSTEVNIEVPDQKFEVEKIEYYNGLELYERIESLKNLAKQ